MVLKLVFLRLTTLELIKVLCCGQDGGNWVMCGRIERDEERESEVGRYLSSELVSDLFVCVDHFNKGGHDVEFYDLFIL